MTRPDELFDAMHDRYGDEPTPIRDVVLLFVIAIPYVIVIAWIFWAWLWEGYEPKYPPICNGSAVECAAHAEIGETR